MAMVLFNYNKIKMTEKEPVRDIIATKDTILMLANSGLPDDLKELLLEMYQEIHSLQLKAESIRKQNTTTKSFLKSSEVCCMLGISKRSLQNWRNQKKIPYLRLMGRIVYDKKAIQEWIKVNS